MTVYTLELCTLYSSTSDYSTWTTKLGTFVQFLHSYTREASAIECSIVIEALLLLYSVHCTLYVLYCMDTGTGTVHFAFLAFHPAVISLAFELQLYFEFHITHQLRINFC